METVATVQVCAPAKVNLVLRVLGRRPDGYHEVWSLLQTVGLEDELTVRVRPGLSGLQVQCDDADLPTDGRNLVHRAAALVLERAGKSVGLEIRLRKRIPVSAGLGGGSSDAAATITALNHVLGLGWSAGVMAQVGAVLGSDVPFFFFAPTAWVRGRGEAVSALTLRGTRWVVLVYPGFPIGTRWAYDQLSAMRDQVRPMREAHHRLPDYRGDPVFWVRATGSQGSAAGSDHGQAGRGSDHHRWYGPGVDDGPSRGADSRVFQYPG